MISRVPTHFTFHNSIIFQTEISRLFSVFFKPYLTGLLTLQMPYNCRKNVVSNFNTSTIFVLGLRTSTSRNIEQLQMNIGMDTGCFV